MPYFPADTPLPDSYMQYVIGWARGLPEMRIRNPGLPADWCPVLSVNPTEPHRKQLETYLWLYELGRVREVYAAQYTFVSGKERPI